MRLFHAIMHGLPYLAAVIPAALDPEGLEWLMSMPFGMTLALHGWDHRRSWDGVSDEFHGVSYKECRERVRHGKALLAPLPVRHFVPPFNALARGLLPAIWHEGIRVVWTGPILDQPKPPRPAFVNGGTVVPSWASTYGATIWQIGTDDRPLKNTLPPLLDQPGVAVISLHLPWEASRGDDFRGMRWLVDTIGDRIISPAEYVRMAA